MPLSTDTKPKLNTIRKSVKLVFCATERNEIGGDLARAIAGLRRTQSEFDQIKASFKARITEAEARIDNLSTSLMNGFEIRDELCVVVYRPKDSQKDFYLADRFEDVETADWDVFPVLTEAMTPEDFQAELVQAESRFDSVTSIELFPPVNSDCGVLVVGAMAGKWYSALRVTIGRNTIEERLDSEQRAFKQRFDAVGHGVKRFKAWAKEHFKDDAKGFDDGCAKILEANKEAVE